MERFRDEALDVLAKIEEGLRAIHARGVVFGDLHPRNLIVRPDGRVCFIDFELASPADEFVRPGLGAAGFAAPRTSRATRSTTTLSTPSGCGSSCR
nr:phosphotransferase [Streptomyces sp. LBUM 1481]